LRLQSELEQYNSSGIYPMHMPGHKRNSALLPFPSPYAIDITEIDGFDNLHDAHGILAKGMKKAAALYGSGASFYLVSGSTCGILAGISACTKQGDAVLMARNCHRSVYHAVSLCRLRPVYLLPKTDEPFGISGSVSPEDVEAALKESGARLVVITSPTYAGVCSDLEAIAGVAHRHGVPLLVDAAHGAHFGFSGYFPPNAVRSGADLVVHSLHKTLPALTQSALLHVNGGFVDPGDVQRALSVFETSSPSYVLMASIDSCIALLEEQSKELFKAYEKLLDRFSRDMEGLEHLRIFRMGGDRKRNHPNVFDFDPGKLILSVKNTSLSGVGLHDVLLRDYRIQLEMAVSTMHWR
jgi:arginine/lysine/ornithine decarboxylase